MPAMGLLIFWDLADYSNREKLKVALERHGCEDLVPAERTFAAALKAALERAYPKPNFRVEALSDRGGYEVVSITKHATHSDMVSVLQALLVSGSISCLEKRSTRCPDS